MPEKKSLKTLPEDHQRRCRDEVCVGRLFHRFVAETGKARLLTVVGLKDGTTVCSELDDRSLDRDGTSATGVK